MNYPLMINGRVVGVDVRRERERVKRHNRRAHNAHARADLRPSEWLLLLFRFSFACAYCGRPFETLDHIVSIVNGGGSTFTNVLPACLGCNNRKGTAVWLPAPERR